MRTVIAVTTCVLAGRPALAWACSTCAASAYGDRTFSWAFLSLMATPFVVAGVIGGIILHVYRRHHEPDR
jgi:hypothetical protein